MLVFQAPDDQIHHRKTQKRDWKQAWKKTHILVQGARKAIGLRPRLRRSLDHASPPLDWPGGWMRIVWLLAWGVDFEEIALGLPLGHCLGLAWGVWICLVTRTWTPPGPYYGMRNT